MREWFKSSEKGMIMLRLSALLLAFGLALFAGGPVWPEENAVPAPPCDEEGAQGVQPTDDLAFVDGLPITRAEVEGPIESQLRELRLEIYRLQSRSLERLINQKVLEKDARKRGLSLEGLVNLEIKPKIPLITQQEIDKEFERLQQAQGKATISKTDAYRSLYTRKYYEVMGEYLERIKKDIPIQIMLEEPRPLVHDVATSDDPWTGNAQAPVILVEFTDFQCPSCKQFHTTMQSILQDLGGQVKLIVRDYPLTSHPLAQKAAEAAQCAHDQKKYWEYEASLFENQETMNGGTFEVLAEHLGLDMDRFRRCLSSGEHRDKVASDKADGLYAGVAGTPALFINGKRWTDLRPEAVRSAIAREIETLKKTTHSGSG
jgi:protein-disulfide isomerase